MSGLAAIAPAMKPASNFLISGDFDPTDEADVPVLLLSAAAAPTRNEPCSSAKSMHSTLGISTTVKVSSCGQ